VAGVGDKTSASGPDYSAVVSLEMATRLVESGLLVPLFLLPEMFGGDDRTANVVFVPAFAAELKIRTDENIILPLATGGKITRYDAEPTYAGNSFVPVSIFVHAHDPGDFRYTLKIWGDGLAS
jgi:hypothetical protein